MNKEQSSSLRSFRRVREFLAAHPQADAPANFAKQASELDEVMQELAQMAQQQNAGGRLSAAEGAKQRARRQTLWNEHMLPVARIAREVYGVPGVKEGLKLPRKSADNDRLVEAARGMADAAEPDKAAFIAKGLPDDFVEQLRDATAALAAALQARDTSGRRRAIATKAVDDQVKRGRSAVRVLNAIMSVRLAKYPPLLAGWDHARRLADIPGSHPAFVESTVAAPLEDKSAA